MATEALILHSEEFLLQNCFSASLKAVSSTPIGVVSTFMALVSARCPRVKAVFSVYSVFGLFSSPLLILELPALLLKHVKHHI